MGIQMDYGLRRQRLAASFPEALPGVLVSNPYDIRYYTGFTGEGYVLIFAASKKDADTSAETSAHVLKNIQTVIFTDARYIGLCRRQCPDIPRIEIPGGGDGLQSIYAYVKKCGLTAVGIDDQHLTVAVFGLMQSVFDGIFLCAASGMIHFPRQIKDGEERKALERAAELSDSAFLHILDYIEPDMTEFEIAAELSRYFAEHQKQAFLEGLSFPVMVASGENSSMPHAPVTNRRIHSGDFVVMDFGCVCQGYCSDMTRTIAVGQPSEKQQRIYDMVLQAQRLALSEICPGASFSAIQEHVKAFFREKGYGDCFLHMLGHGVGLGVHEEPLCTESVHDVLVPGMVLAVEPGIYIAEEYGVRIEDMIIVTEQGCDRLTKSRRSLQIVM